MTNFKTATDTGYVRVRDQLWLWYNMVKENQDAWKEKKVAAKRQHLRQPASAVESNNGGNISGGSVFNGPTTAHNMMAGTYFEGSTTTFNFS